LKKHVDCGRRAGTASHEQIGDFGSDFERNEWTLESLRRRLGTPVLCHPNNAVANDRTSIGHLQSWVIAYRMLNGELLSVAILPSCSSSTTNLGRPHSQY
jgi:hypothetical protein